MSLAVVLSAVALVVALAAAGLAAAVARQGGRVASALDRHRNGHRVRDGAPDPGTSRSHRPGRPDEPERREVNLGPPRSTGERRYAPGQLLLPEDPPPAMGDETSELPAVGPRTAARPPARPLPRPGQVGKL